VDVVTRRRRHSYGFKMACTRALILPLIFLNAIINVYLLYRILKGWAGLNRDAESEWEGGSHQLARTTAAISVAYIILASTASAIGFHGVYKRLLPSVRLYLQFSFVDFAAYLLGMVILAFRIYKPKDWKDNLCEEASVHPDVLRALRSGGFNIESCESWIEKLVLGAMTILGVGLVLKLQFTLAIASYYTSLAKATGHQASFFSTIRVPNSRRMSKSHRDRHILLTQSRSSDLPPYSDNPETPTMGPEAAEAAAELIERSTRAYERERRSSSGDDTIIDAKRRA